MTMLKKTILLLLLIALVIAPTTLLAKKGHRDRHLFDQLDRATIDLGQAVKRVENQMKGKVYKARLEKAGRRNLVFMVHSLIKDEVIVVTVDPRSGQIINATQEGFWEKWTERSLRKAARSTNIPLSQAISIAEKACGGKASRARLELSDDLVHYAIDVEAWYERCKVLVDSENGEFFILRDRDRKHE